MNMAADVFGKLARRPIWSRIVQFLFGPGVPNRAPQVDPQPAATDSTAKQFRREVESATHLLHFLLQEGPSCQISDQIIDDIEAARDLLKSPDVAPTKENRVKLLKAYRDLIDSPRFSVKYARIPPVYFWDSRSFWPTILLWVAVIPTVIWLITILTIKSLHWSWYWMVLYDTLSVLAVFGIYVFTGLVTDRKLNEIIKFCYIFTGFSLIISLMPFSIPSLFTNPSTDTPVNVVLGCSVGRDGEATSPNNDEAACSKSGQPAHYQWVIDIGGAIEPLTPSTSSRTGAGVASSATPGNHEPTHYQIQGGLVVPLYVVVLALFGSAVSMTRRVPEYQRRAMDVQDPLTNVLARENLVFQIMQVISAPLIAVTVYYLVPNSGTNSVILGFGSGFASEPILLMIRSLVEKLSPAPTTEPDALTVRVDPSAVVLQPNTTRQFSAKISGSTNTEVTWEIDPADAGSGTISQSGFYSAPAVPPEKAVTITARSKADPTKSGKASVKIETVAVKVNPATVTLTAG
jgi:hypothetical protein